MISGRATAPPRARSECFHLFFKSDLPDRLTNVNGTLFFRAGDPDRGFDHGVELWKSDGTNIGTVLAKDINPGYYDSNRSNLINVDGTLFFTAASYGSGTELWKSDGTTAGTVLVKDIMPGTGSSVIQSLVNLNGKVYFAADDGVHGEELWRSDGTSDGTQIVKDIFPGSGRSINAYQMDLTNVNGTLFFNATNDLNFHQLWKSDGTESGTVLVKSFNSIPPHYYATNFTNFKGQLFFTADNIINGEELWKSDGTTSGTVLVEDINSSLADSNPGELVGINGTLYFYATTSTQGTELWKTDGTEAGTVLVKDLNPGTASSSLHNLVNGNGALFFLADDGVHGVKLWRLAPVSAGDFNRDGFVNSADIAVMQSVLVDRSSYQTQQQLSDADLLTIGDLDHDGRFTSADLQALLNLLRGSSAKIESNQQASTAGDSTGDSTSDALNSTMQQAIAPSTQALTRPTGLFLVPAEEPNIGEANPVISSPRVMAVQLDRAEPLIPGPLPRLNTQSVDRLLDGALHHTSSHLVDSRLADAASLADTLNPESAALLWEAVRRW